MKFYGSIRDDTDKKLERVTVSMSQSDYKFIKEIADAKGLSNSEVINNMLKPTMQAILKQKELIVVNPMAVAFDLMTSG